MINNQDPRRAEDGDAPRRGHEEVSRAEEVGEADEPDAPTDVEENEGMSTILDAEPLTGVQDDASQE